MELRPDAVEPAYWQVSTDAALTNPPAVRFDGAGTWHATAWADATAALVRRCVLTVAHPSVTAPPADAVVLATGTHTSELLIVDGSATFVRPASDTIVVKPAPAVTA